MKPNKLLALTLALAMPILAVSCGDKAKDGFDYSKGLDANGFFEGVKATDYVTLPVYKGVEVDKSVLTVTQADIDEQVNGVLESHGSYEQLKTGTIKDGDTVNIDYVGSVDGVEFEGGSTGGAGTDVTIGVTSYIDDFLEQLIGHKPGDTFDVNVTFPDPYESNTDLSGKDAVFKTTINYIQGELILPELDATIAAEYGFDSVDAMLADIEGWLIEKQKMEVFNGIIEKAEVSEIPQVVLDFVIDYDIYNLEQSAAMYGLTADVMLNAFYGYESVEAYKQDNMENYETNAKMYLAAQAIAELEAASIKVTDADIEAAGMTDYIDTYGKPYIIQYIMFQTKLPSFIIDNANIK